ncbi:MAG TPA: hypothetical protein VGC60_15640 [Pyrinomonadaceae bacterium]
MLIKKLVASFLLIAVACLSASAQTERAPQRIVFARGATVARATGHLRGNRDSAWFVLRASTGQHMRVSINARDATHGTVISPTGKQETQPGVVVFDDDLSETGDYKIGVSESPMANAWRGNFTVVVEILPRGQATPQTSNLERYVGKYPNELFRGVPSVKTRLRQLLGTNYKAFTDRMQVETPIEKDGDTIVMRGCMAHSCTIEEAILVIDLNDGTPYVALRFNSKFRPPFAADRSQIPQSLRRAMRQE